MDAVHHASVETAAGEGAVRASARAVTERRARALRISASVPRPQDAAASVPNAVSA